MGLLNCEHHDKSFRITKINEFSKIADDNQEDVDMEDGRRQIFYEQTILICWILRVLLYLNNMTIPQQIASYGCVKWQKIKSADFYDLLLLSII